MLHPLLMAFIASIIVWTCISIGSAAVFKKEIPIKPLTYVYGLASGVMLAAVFFSLLSPSLEAATALDQYPLLPGSLLTFNAHTCLMLMWLLGWLFVEPYKQTKGVIGFLLGCLFVYAIERAMPGPDGTWCTCLRRHKLENSALRQVWISSLLFALFVWSSFVVSCTLDSYRTISLPFSKSLMIDRTDDNSYRLMEESSVNGDVGTHSGHSHGPK